MLRQKIGAAKILLVEKRHWSLLSFEMSNGCWMLFPNAITLQTGRRGCMASISAFGEVWNGDSRFTAFKI